MNISVVGCGYWGKNLIRNYFELGCLYSVSDSNIEVAEDFAHMYKCKPQSLEEIISDSRIDGVVISAPAEHHKEIACKLLAANKNIFIEKPLAMNVAEAVLIKEALNKSSGLLMVGHLLQFHPGFILLKQLVHSGNYGSINNIISRRSSFGRIRRSEDVLWSFAPHDISMILGLAKSSPKEVLRIDHSFLQSKLSDISFLNLKFDGYTANISVSWIHPRKEQQLIVVCDKAILLFDDTLPWSEKVSVKSYELSNIGNEIALIDKETKFFPIEDNIEPLKLECEHFIGLIQGKKENITDINEGINVLKVLEQAKLLDSIS
ncbi:MAG: Gfo/Idh/MocA family oxidoreductase [Gammaproteobacteria bacterium]